MIKKTETEIIKNWKTQENPVVSILCIAYNHENYIEEALDSFLIQETNYPFEIIIHDDASTDNTVNKIKAYAKKYPHIIKTILQEENQYSQGKMIDVFLFEKAKGKYYAICEGDDYWIDAKKLQIQVDLMEQNPECDMSFHASERRLNNDIHGKVFANPAKNNKVFSASEVILGKGYIPTASLVFRKKVVSNLPSFYHDSPVGDYPLQILGSVNGGILYINRVMSVYRQGIAGSWTSRTNNNVSQREKLTQRMIETLDKFDMYLNKKYENEIREVKSYYYYKLSLMYLRSDMFKEFKHTIELSWNIDKISSIQSLCYYLRFVPQPLKLLYSIKDIFK